MFPYRMSRQSSVPRVFLTIVTLSSLLTGAASDPVLDAILPAELSQTVPNCAAECFRSFIKVNYKSGHDDAIPEISYLCSHESASGLTLGEGALQCLTAEMSIGYCSPSESSGE